MTGLSYRSISVRLITSHKVLGFWNCHTDSESTACWMQQIWFLSIWSSQLQQYNNKKKVDNPNIAIQAFGIKLIKNWANKRFRLLKRI